LADVGRGAGRGVARLAGEGAVGIAAIAVGHVAVVAVFGARDEEVAADVVAAHATLADLAAAAFDAVVGGRARRAGVVFRAGLHAVARIGVVADVGAHGGALGAGPGAIGLAAVARYHVAVVADLGVADDAVDDAIEVVAALAASAPRPLAAQARIDEGVVATTGGEARRDRDGQPREHEDRPDSARSRSSHRSPPATR